MRTLIIFLSMTTLIALQKKSLKFKDASFHLGSKSLKISGMVYLFQRGNIAMGGQYCVDFSTMTPYMMNLYSNNSKHEGNVITTKCTIAILGKNFVGKKATGEVKFVIDGNMVNTKIDCKIETGDQWIFSTIGPNSKYVEYEYKEAGLRARSLIGQDINFYKGPNIMLYAIRSNPYAIGCYLFDSFGPETKDIEPGYLVIGNDKKHCGILDNEGTKFVHDNPNKKKVIDTPLAMAKQFFFNGFYDKSSGTFDVNYCTHSQAEQIT